MTILEEGRQIICDANVICTFCIFTCNIVSAQEYFMYFILYMVYGLFFEVLTDADFKRILLMLERHLK